MAATEEYKPGPWFKVGIFPTTDGGTEFYNPPVRGAAQAFAQTVVFIATFGFLVLVCKSPPPGAGIAFYAISGLWGIIELLFFMWILRLWFAPERVVIGNGKVSYTYGILGRTRTMTSAEVTLIHVTKGGYTRHWAIKIVGAGWHTFHVFDGILRERDGEWLAQQMSRAVGLKAADPIPFSSEADMVENVAALSAYAKEAASKGPMPLRLMASRLDQQMSEFQQLSDTIKHQEAERAGNPSLGVPDIQPTASATVLGNAENTPNVSAEDIARGAFGVSGVSQADQTQTTRRFPTAARILLPLIFFAAVTVRSVYRHVTIVRENSPTDTSNPINESENESTGINAETNTTNVATNPANVVNASDAENGRTLDVPQGAMLRITLPMSSGTGAWFIAENDSGLLAPQGAEFHRTPGEPRNEVFLFAAGKKGTAHLKLDSDLPEDQSKPRAGTFGVTLAIH